MVTVIDLGLHISNNYSGKKFLMCWAQVWFSMIVMWAVPWLIATHALKVVFSFCIITIQPKT
jgi:hypothetical protein